MRRRGSWESSVSAWLSVSTTRRSSCRPTSLWEQERFLLGQLSQAHAHLEQGMRLYDPQQHHALAFRYGNVDPGAACLSFAGLTLWVQGYPDQALERANEALTLAQNLEHPYTLARVLYYTTLLHQLRREWQMVSERAETAITVATAQQVALVLTLGPIMRGWALAMQGQGAEGLTQLRQGLDAYRATGAEFQRPHFLSMLAEVHRSLGQPEAGLTALSEALALVEKPANATTKRSCIGSRASCCCSTPPRRCRTPRPVSSSPSTLPVVSRQNRSSCGPP